MGKYKHNHNKNNDEEEIAKQNINRTKLLIYSPSKSLPSAPGRILIDNRRTIRRNRRMRKMVQTNTRRRKTKMMQTQLRILVRIMKIMRQLRIRMHMGGMKK